MSELALAIRNAKYSDLHDLAVGMWCDLQLTSSHDKTAAVFDASTLATYMIDWANDQLKPGEVVELKK